MNHIAPLFSRERFAYAAALLLPFALVLTTHAQTPGDYLRLKLTSGYLIEGRVFELKPDTVTFITGLQLTPVAIDQVAGAEYLAGQTTKRRRGALIGLGIGAMISVAAICASECALKGFDDLAGYLGTIGLVSLPTAGLGILIGSLSKEDRWEVIVLNRPVSQAGLLGAGVRLTL